MAASSTSLPQRARKAARTPAYSASKAAVIALTKSLGKEAAATGIRVNSITPAAIKTRLFDQMTAQHIEVNALQDSAREVWRDRRGDLAHLLARQRGVLVQHGRLLNLAERFRHVCVANNLRECAVAFADDHSSSVRSAAPFSCCSD